VSVLGPLEKRLADFEQLMQVKLTEAWNRLSALESLTAWVNDPAPPDTTIDHLAEIQKVILWVLKQPWERDVASWEELVRLASKGTEKSLTFRQEVVTPPPVRDLL
jgi:hypothetical protein